MTEWTYHRSFLEVLRTGSQSQAAKRLGLAQPTVRRHIEMLERDLGRTLFLRSPSGLVPNDLAIAMRGSAEAIEAHAAAIERRANAAESMSGTVRISASRAIAAKVLPSYLKTLRSQQPALRFEVEASNDASDLFQRASDIAIRMVKPTQLDLVQRYVGDVAVGFFAHRDWISENGNPADIIELAEKGALLGFDRDPDLNRLWTAYFPDLKPASFALRCDDEAALFSALRAGLGVGICQQPIARRDQNLVPVLTDWRATMGIWIVTHPDLRADPKISCVFEHICACFAEYVAN